MSRFILAAAISAVALAGCGHTVYRDTVVEKQPVVVHEVIERPVVAQPTLVPSAPTSVAPVTSSSTVLVPPVGSHAACALGNTPYLHGTLSCISNYQYQCVDGVWQPLQGVSC